MEIDECERERCGGPLGPDLRIRPSIQRRGKMVGGLVDLGLDLVCARRLGL